MKNVIYPLAMAWGVYSLGVEAKEKQPNIVFIMADPFELFVLLDAIPITKQRIIPSVTFALLLLMIRNIMTVPK